VHSTSLFERRNLQLAVRPQGQEIDIEVQGLITLVDT
jgi:hypothetical protein